MGYVFVNCIFEGKKLKCSSCNSVKFSSNKIIDIFSPVPYKLSCNGCGASFSFLPKIKIAAN